MTPVLRNDPPRHRSAGLFDVCAAKRTRPRNVPAPERTGCEPYRLFTGGWAPAWLVWNDSADPVVDNGLPDALADTSAMPARAAVSAQPNQLGRTRDGIHQSLAAPADEVALALDCQCWAGDLRSPVQHGVVAHLIDVGTDLANSMRGHSGSEELGSIPAESHL